MNDLVVTPTQAITALLEGKIGVLPTDTIYGLVAVATDQQAVARLYSLKARHKKPGTVIAASTEQLHSLGIAQADIAQVAQWWPNPLSAVLPVDGSDHLHLGVDSLAVRVVADQNMKELLEQTGPLLTSSANVPGYPEATTISQAYEYFGSKVDFYIDGGLVANRLPSTIIRPTPQGIEVLRQGTIHVDTTFTSPS